MTPEQRIAHRVEFRVGLFQRRGRSPDESRELAEMLTRRDASGDDRRLCLECSGLQRSGYCFPASQGRLLPNASRRLQPCLSLLQRCEAFDFQRPS